MILMDVLDHCLISARTVTTVLAAGQPDSGTSNTWQVNGNLTGAKNDGGAFDNLSNSISTTGNSLVYILMMIIGFVGVIGLGIAVIKIMVGGAQTKSEAKGSLFWILVAAVIGFGAMAIIGVAQTIGSGLLGAGSNTTP